jgi:ribosome maturation factor RimP
MQYRQDLHDLLEPAVQAAGYELYGLEFSNQGRHSILRVYIDHEDGINVDDCASASHQVSAVLDVEDPISGEYTLEVSSPGMERPLFFTTHFTDVQGEKVKIHTRSPIEGQRKFIGSVVDCSDEALELQQEEEKIVIPLAEINKAHLIVNF